MLSIQVMRRPGRPPALLTWIVFTSLTLTVPLFVTAKEVTSTRGDDLAEAAEALRLNRHPKQDQAAAVPDIIGSFLELDRSLPNLQSQELSKYLAHAFGIEIPPARARAYVDALSASNLARLTSPRVLRSRDFATIHARLEKYFSYYQHNMNQRPPRADQQPYWLSSARLAALNLNPGLQTKPFNKDFLGTQNWIFFFAGGDNESFYGEDFIRIDAKFANPTGVVLPFVMTPSDLARIGLDTMPDLGQNLLKEMKALYPEVRTNPDSYRYLDWLVEAHHEATARRAFEYKDVFTQFRTSMLHLIFNPADYRTLVAAKVTERFWRRRWLHPREYLTMNIDLGTMQRAMREARLPDRFEMRIPVAIPTRQLTFGGECQTALGGAPVAGAHSGPTH